MILSKTVRKLLLAKIFVAGILMGCNEISGPQVDPQISAPFTANMSTASNRDTTSPGVDSLNSTLNVGKVGTVTLNVTFQTSVSKP